MNRGDRLLQDGALEHGDPVLFYASGDPFGEFSNFSRHGIWARDPFTGVVVWHATGEHRYQAMKARDEASYRFVNEGSGPGAAKHRGGPRGIALREGWGNDYGHLCWYVMFETVLLKAQQHPQIRRLLLATGDRHIYEDSPTDDIWGWRFENDYRGKNLLGRCWMDVREVLRGG